MTLIYATISALVLVTGAFLLAHHGMTAELIVLGAVAAFVIAVPLISRMERRT